jgi:type IX secretion system substrate protein
LSTFDPGTGNYLAARSTSTYAGGTVRYDMVTVTSNVTLATSQFHVNQNEFTVYPNPSNKEIVNLNEPQDIRVYDIAGKLILEAKQAKTIDTKSFNPGVYFIQTASGLTRKLIVK